MSPLYDQLDQDEKTAIEIAIVYPHRALSRILPEFYSGSISTLYRYRKKGVEKLKSKGLLDLQEHPTALAFETVPEKYLRKMTLKLHRELISLEKERSANENAKFAAQSELRRLQKYTEESEAIARNLTFRLDSISRSKIQDLIQRFKSFGIDENWISVLIALNLVEMTMRYKIESLGARPHGNFKELYDLLKREVLTKEKREIKISSEFIKPKHLYDWRSKMDHDGLKVKIKEKEADFIIEQALKFIEELKIS